MTRDTSSSDAVVELIKVGKSYPPDVEALKEISLGVSAGEMIFLTGRSGAGKTTLLRLLCRIEQPDKGLVEIFGTDINKLSQGKLQKMRRRIGMAYQDFKLLPERSVARNIALAMEVTYRKKSFIRKQTRQLLEHLDLVSRQHARAAELSRGEQQRVAIARALANNPDLILADEPTGNLDSETTGRVMSLFMQHLKRGATILIATHDPSIYENSEHRVLTLKGGTLHEGTPADQEDEP